MGSRPICTTYIVKPCFKKPTVNGRVGVSTPGYIWKSVASLLRNENHSSVTQEVPVDRRVRPFLPRELLLSSQR